MELPIFFRAESIESCDTVNNLFKYFLNPPQTAAGKRVQLIQNLSLISFFSNWSNNVLSNRLSFVVFHLHSMSLLRQELADYGRQIAAAGLSAGAGGNISAREGRLVWVKPSGLSMAELKGTNLCCVDVDSGRQIEGKLKPTSELLMHLAVYRVRSDILAIFHTHSPWASGVITAGVDFKPMFAEVVNDLGGIAAVPYKKTSTQELASAVAEAARDHETIFLANHGVVTLGKTMKQAFFRCCVAEDAAKSFVAASIVGKPSFLTEEQIRELKSLPAGAHRLSMMERS